VSTGGAHFGDPDYTKNNKIPRRLGQAGLPHLIGYRGRAVIVRDG
jgi:hypothetical protein